LSQNFDSPGGIGIAKKNDTITKDEKLTKNGKANIVWEAP
jgi:hypothetical protein